MRRSVEATRDHAPHLGQLLHQVRLRVQAAGRVDDHDVAAASHTGLHRVVRDRSRIGAALGADEVRPGPLRPDLELLLRRRSVRVGRAHDDRPAVLREPRGELADRRRLAGAVDADDEDHGRLVRRRRAPEPRRRDRSPPRRAPRSDRRARRAPRASARARPWRGRRRRRRSAPPRDVPSRRRRRGRRTQPRRARRSAPGATSRASRGAARRSGRRPPPRGRAPHPARRATEPSYAASCHSSLRMSGSSVPSARIASTSRSGPPTMKSTWMFAMFIASSGSPSKAYGSPAP